MTAKRFSLILILIIAIQLIFALPIAALEKEHHHCTGEHCPVCMMMFLIIQENHYFILSDSYKKTFSLLFSVASILLYSNIYFETISLFSLKKKLTS